MGQWSRWSIKNSHFFHRFTWRAMYPRHYPCYLIGSGDGKVSHFYTVHFVMFLEAQPGPLLVLWDLQRLPPSSTESAALLRTAQFCCSVWLFECESYWNRNESTHFCALNSTRLHQWLLPSKILPHESSSVSISNSLILGTWGFCLWVDWFGKNTFLPRSFAILINFLLPRFCFADPFQDQREYLEGSDN